MATNNLNVGQVGVKLVAENGLKVAFNVANSYIFPHISIKLVAYMDSWVLGVPTTQNFDRPNP